MRRAAGLLALFAGLAVLHTWPLAGDLDGLSRLDNDDGGLNVFIVSWFAHVMPRDPLALFEAPMFFPERHTLAYSEHMLVPSLMGAPLLWAGLSPVFTYNVLVIAGFTLSGWSMALVMRRWTGDTWAAAMAGMLYAFNAHLLTRLVHLQALHLEFLPWALFAIDRVLGSDGADRSSAGNRSTRSVPAVAALTAAFVLQALCSNYTLVFLSVGLLVAALVRARDWLWPLQRRRAIALVVAGAVSVLILAPFLWPYYVVSREQGLTRSIDEVALYSAGWADYLATGGRLHFAAWSHRWFEGRTPLFPGVIASLLAGGALLVPSIRRDPRVRMVAAIGAAGAWLSFGPALPGYAWLHAYVPLFTGIRGAARWGLLPLIAIAVLAGFGMADWRRRLAHSAYRPAIAIALLAGVTLEALRAPMAFTGVPRIPPLYDAIAADARAVIVELPLYYGAAVSENARYLYTGTRHFRPMVNGYSGFESEGFRQRAVRWRRFPETAVLQEMSDIGVNYVVLHVADLDPGIVSAARRTDRLELVLDDGSRRLYRLRW